MTHCIEAHRGAAYWKEADSKEAQQGDDSGSLRLGEDIPKGIQGESGTDEGFDAANGPAQSGSLV